MDRRLTPLASVLALLLSCTAGPAAAASFPPHLRFQSLRTERVTVHFHQGLLDVARQAASLSDQILAGHEARYGYRVPRVHVVVSDIEDDPNGFASPLPYPLVHVRAVPASGSDDFGSHDGWLRLVLVHELAHVIHLEQGRGVIGAARRVLGRAPYLFPNAASPAWLVEGLATYEETEATAFGRGRNPDVRMVLRMAALEGGFPREDEAITSLDRWPGGIAAYLFGESFLRDLTLRNGAATLPEIARVHAGRPVPYLDELTARKVTGATFHTQWRTWMDRSRARFEDEAARIRARGVTESRALTSRGVKQFAPRFSPDGSLIAYTSRSLTRYRAIHVMRADGSGDRRLVSRSGGNGLSWTPDGLRLVFEEAEHHRTFTTRYDLRVVDVRTGRVRRLTRGLRAREPSVSPTTSEIVFVRQVADRSELALMPLAGGPSRDLTQSAPGVMWSFPRWSPDGRAIAAARLTPDGRLDMVLVDAGTGALRPLLEDRAKDVEAAWTPDGGAIVFRSDRDGVSNLYAHRLADGALLRVTNVVGGAFAPDVAPDGRSIAFARYGGRGYDIHVAPLDLAALALAEPFADPYPASLPMPAPAAGTAAPYNALSVMWPRFWSPYVELNGDIRLGVGAGGLDPLFRHAYGVAAHHGVGNDALGLLGFYQYDRFRPTILVTVQDERETQTIDGQEGRRHVREVDVQATAFVRRTLRATQTVTVAYRRGRDTFEETPAPEREDTGGIEVAWTLAASHRFPFSVAPVEGYRLRAAVLQEARALGSDDQIAKLMVSGRFHRRVLGEVDAVALRVAGGTTLGQPSLLPTFAVGGFAEDSLFGVRGSNHAVLRGHPRDEYRGRHFGHASLEYRFPLAHPQRGLWTAPVFARSLHGAVYADAASAWNGAFQMKDVKTAIGAAVGADLILSNLPVTATAGLAQGFGGEGGTRAYFRAALSF